MISRRSSGRAPVDTDMRSGFNRDKATLALQRAIKATFDDSRWHELGYLVGKHDVIVDHERLLRSLQWGDDDYSSCIFTVLPDLLGHDFRNLRTIAEFVGLRDWLRKKDTKLYAELYDDEAPEPIVSLEHVEQAAGIHDVLELNRHAARNRLLHARAGHLDAAPVDFLVIPQPSEQLAFAAPQIEHARPRLDQFANDRVIPPPEHVKHDSHQACVLARNPRTISACSFTSTRNASCP